MIIYRPPDSSYSSFFQDFSRLFKQVLTDAISHIIISGDFNLHVENLKNHHARQFIGILDCSFIYRTNTYTTYNTKIILTYIYIYIAQLILTLFMQANRTNTYATSILTLYYIYIALFILTLFIPALITIYIIQ